MKMEKRFLRGGGEVMLLFVVVPQHDHGVRVYFADAPADTDEVVRRGERLSDAAASELFPNLRPGSSATSPRRPGHAGYARAEARRSARRYGERTVT